MQWGEKFSKQRKEYEKKIHNTRKSLATAKTFKKKERILTTRKNLSHEKRNFHTLVEKFSQQKREKSKILATVKVLSQQNSIKTLVVEGKSKAVVIQSIILYFPIQ